MHKESRQISWQSLADELELDHRTLQAMVEEKRDITIPTMKKLARHFGWTAGDVGAMVRYMPRGVREKKRLKQEGKKP